MALAVPPITRQFYKAADVAHASSLHSLRQMKITDVEALHLRVPNVEEIADGTQDVLIVRVTTDDGLVGIGEVSSQSYVCKAIIEAPRSAERRHGLREIVVGQDATDVEGLWERMYYHTNRYGRRGAAVHAMSGVDIALWDLRGKALGRPIYELWGTERPQPITAYASYLFGATPDDTFALAQRRKSWACRPSSSAGGPFGRDADVDRQHVAAARRGIGDRSSIDGRRRLQVGRADGARAQQDVGRIQRCLARRAAVARRPGRLRLAVRAQRPCRSPPAKAKSRVGALPI